tara:strand:- start:1567 stop:1941 length:375 start_codon:yes stop_codon:yes gene_type:complete
MNYNIYSRFALFIFSSSLPLSAIASDFNVLTVGLGAFIIALILIFLCIKGSSAARKKPRNEVAAYSFGSLFLSIIGTAMVVQESPHMSNSDFYGFIAILVIPGFLAFILPLVLSKPNSNETDQP